MDRGREGRGIEAPRERPLARTERASPARPPFAAAAAPPPGSLGSLPVSHSVRHRRQLSERAGDRLRRRQRHCRRSPREDLGTGREGEARSPIPSLLWGLLSRPAARRPRATPFTATSRGVPGLGDAAREEPGQEAAAAAAERGCAHWDWRGVSGGLRGGGGGRSRGCLPASPLGRQHRLPGPRPPGRVLRAFPGPEPAHDAPSSVLITAAPLPPPR